LAVLKGFDVSWFTGFTPNPTLAHALAGSAAMMRCDPDVVVAIGGGSAIDTAKLARALPADPAGALRVLAGEADLAPDAHRPLIALPTTAGTGSEVTRFATVYIDGVKGSLDHPAVLPQHALVDPELLVGSPRWVMYSCAFDRLCHAVESFWSKRATEASRRLALAALRGVTGVLRKDLRRAGPDELLVLAGAATVAGQAIDITRTTAAHAFSYHMTARFGVPHGVACILNLLWLLKYNRDHAGPSAEVPMATLTGQLCRVGSDDDVVSATRVLVDSSGFASRLGAYGIGPADIDGLVDAGLASGRAANNPVDLRRRQVTDLLRAMV
jgi:alcohol dehydrogenase class IV